MEDADRMETDSPVVPVLGSPALPPEGDLRSELAKAVAELSFCELASSAQWAAELLSALPAEQAGDDSFCAAPVGVGAGASSKLYSSIMLAKSHFSMREYSRAAYALQNIKDLHKHQSALFLRLYSAYLAGEKRREEEAMEVADPVEKCQVKNHELKMIEEHLASLHGQNLLDGMNLYLYGITLRGLELKAEARKVLLQSVRVFPCNWSAWSDIIGISADLDDVGEFHTHIELHDHWMICFFQAALNMELQCNEEAKKIYIGLQRHFPESSYILSQIATCYYNKRNFDESQATFEEVRKKDPYKLASLDTYSNILYVKEQSAALSHLARQAIKIDKYTPEACCIIGNYYSLKGEHEKSVTYFQRALCLNRNFTPAWILMGHEFMEMKNTPAAIDAYRTAVNINQRDYRAWYGLGQTYELLNLHFYALFYYKRAMNLRPEDARMWCAMAQCYDFMDRKNEALKCYEKAHRCGDKEKMALPRLARLHQDLGDRRQAAAYYSQMITQSSPSPLSKTPKTSGSGLSTEVVEALKFLMVFHREEGNLAECEACASQLLDTAGPEKDEAKAMLRDLRGASRVPPLAFDVGTARRQQPVRSIV
jgi:anaphase-promoting complex subunit 8